MNFWKKMLAAAAVFGTVGCAANDLALPFTGVVLDVRTAEEFAAGRVKGAKLLPYDEISSDSAAKLIPEKSTPVVVYCRSGRRSKIAFETLQKLGYTNLTDLATLGNAAKVLGQKIVTGN